MFDRCFNAISNDFSTIYAVEDCSYKYMKI